MRFMILFLFLSSLCHAEERVKCEKCLVVFKPPKGSICENWDFGIEPDMQINETDLTEERAKKSIEWLSKNIISKGGETGNGKLNNLKVIKGYIFKSDVINAKPEYKAQITESFCIWLRDEGFWYD